MSGRPAFPGLEPPLQEEQPATMRCEDEDRRRDFLDSDLPWETISNIYSYVLRTKISMSEYQMDLTLVKTKGGHNSVTGSIDDDLDRLLLTSTAHNDHVGQYLHRSVPMHVELAVKLSSGCNDWYEFNIENLNRMIPTSVRGLYITAQCEVVQEAFDDAADNSTAEFEWVSGDETTEWPVDGISVEDELANNAFVEAFERPHEEATGSAGTAFCGDITATTAFVEFKRRLQACKVTEDIVLVFDIEREDPFGGEPAAESQEAWSLFEQLVATVEGMPRIKRYSIHVGRFSASKVRKPGQDWKAAGVIHINQETAFGPHDESYCKLLSDLHIQSLPLP
ncbi:hypothetical protein CBER1_11396 [Cercospora berteroae]|uniref:Uncharacterized protein n=1 Tax=Cercospora berteroae TaxID=357750 RepID=A0A2S6CFS5_9PEZI|nr:hypothetical protein CBER1_11396 [Cercospora berteroae]